MAETHNPVKIILTTHDDKDEAVRLSEILIESGAAACVNIITGVTSVFSWRNRLQKESEIILLIKTLEDNVPEVTALLEEHHTYDVPEIIELDGDVLHEPYMDWVRSVTAS